VCGISIPSVGQCDERLGSDGRQLLWYYSFKSNQHGDKYDSWVADNDNSGFRVKGCGLFRQDTEDLFVFLVIYIHW
jgi:hypothetical protein